MREFKLNKTSDSDIDIFCYAWDEVTNPKAIVQISHGMGEYLGRYTDFAKFLNKNGYIVVGDDHRGHGKTSGKEKLGITKKTNFFDTVNDIIKLGEESVKKYNLPIILLGHSFGSFLSQAVIQNTNLYKKVVLVGSCAQNTPLVASGRLVATCQRMLFGGNKPAKLMTKLSFASYDKDFKSENQLNAWLSTNKDNVIKYNSDEFCGYMFDINFYYSMAKAFKKIYKKSSLENINKELPIYITSGSDDPVGEKGKGVLRLVELYKKHGLNTSYKIYDGKRHEILNEIGNNEIYNDILKFINK